MEEKLSGIVLGGVNYGENDKILKVFTLEQGTVSAKIKGVKKAGAKLRFASEPFCFAEFIFSNTNKGRTVIGASLIDSFYTIRVDLIRYYCATAVIEFLRRFELESIVNKDMFILTLDTLKKLAYGDEEPKSLLVKFLLQALKLTGYSINLSGCYKCGCEIEGKIYFDCYSGGFSCDECFEQDGREINYSTYLALRQAEKGEEISEDGSILALRLLDFYLINKTQEKLNSLKELLKITA